MEPGMIRPVTIEPPAKPDMERRREGRYVLYDDMFPLEWPGKKYELENEAEAGRLRIPHFPTSQVAVWVLGKSADWMKHKLRTSRGPLLVDGEEIHFRRLAHGRRSAQGTAERRLTLPDCERFVLALQQNGDITGQELQRAMDIIVTLARQYGIEVPITDKKEA